VYTLCLTNLKFKYGIKTFSGFWGLQSEIF
jgi:hypothetical protein